METNLLNEQKLILEPMAIVREYCRLGHKLRNKLKIPVTYPLYEMRINMLELPYATEDELCLLRDERQLIADELNIDFIEPVMTALWSKHSIVKTLTEGLYRIELDVSKDHFLERRYQERLNHRQKMEARKHGDTV